MARWQLTGDYFENCNCDVVCPCLVSTAAPLTARPSQGACDVAIAFHIDRGSYDGVPLDGVRVRLDGDGRVAALAAVYSATAAPDSRWAISRGVIHGAAPLRAPLSSCSASGMKAPRTWYAGASSDGAMSFR